MQEERVDLHVQRVEHEVPVDLVLHKCEDSTDHDRVVHHHFCNIPSEN